MQVFDFELSSDEMKLIESFNIPFRACIPMIEVSQGQDLGVQNGPLLISFFSQLRLLIPLKGDVCLWVLGLNCAQIGVSVNSENPNPTMQLRWSVDTWLALYWTGIWHKTCLDWAAIWLLAKWLINSFELYFVKESLPLGVCRLLKVFC